MSWGRVGSPKRDSIVFEPRKQSFEHLICKYSKRWKSRARTLNHCIPTLSFLRRNLNDRLSNNEIGWLRFLIMRNWVSENKIVWLGGQDTIDLKLTLCRRERDFFSDQHSLSIIIIFIEEYQASDKILFGLVNDFLKKDLINGVTTDYLKPRQRTQHLKHF